MTPTLRRPSFAALIIVLAMCSLESVVAQSNDKTEPWEGEWKQDRMTDAKMFVLSTNVRTENGFYQLVLKCEPNRIAVTLTAFTKTRDPRRITTHRPSNGRWIQLRIDRHPAFGAWFDATEYHNRLQSYLNNFTSDVKPERVKQQLLDSKSILIGNVLQDEVFEVKTSLDQAMIDACKQSSAPKTKSGHMPHAPELLGRMIQRIVQECQAKWRRSEADCRFAGRAVRPWLRDYDDEEDVIEILTFAFTIPAREPERSERLAELGRRLQRPDQRGRNFSRRMQEAILAFGADCRQK